MKKVSVFLSVIVSIMLFITIAMSSVFALPYSGGASTNTNSCEYYYSGYDSNGDCYCIWCGIEGEFCTYPSCGNAS